MNRPSAFVAIALFAFLCGACGKSEPPPDPVSDVRTIQQPGDVPLATETSDMLSASANASLPPMVDLPFAPAISMDPVDGGKVSIRPETPVTEYKGRIYYFRSEDNRKLFLRNPDKYATGSLGHY